MPPTRTFPPAKAIRTGRTHEENQERSVFLVAILLPVTDLRAELTLQPREELTEVSRPESSRRGARLRSTNAEQVARSASPSRMSLTKRCTRRKTMTSHSSTNGSRHICRPAQPNSTDVLPPISPTRLPCGMPWDRWPTILIPNRL